MDFEEPDGPFRWTSAPLGETWPVKVYLPSPLPSTEELAQLADTAQHAHSVDALEAVMRGWASDQGLVVERFYAKGAVSVRFGLG
jgi:hypothetical protein